MEEDVAQPPGPSSNDSSQPQGNLNKACEPCRGSKLRCIIEDNSPDGSCKRCLATGRTCVFNAPRVRQRRKLHVDARVAELERQLRALRMQLNEAQRPAGSDRSPAHSATSSLKFEAPLTPASWPRKSDFSGKDLVPYDTSHPSLSPDRPSPDLAEGITPQDDVVSRKIISWQEAERLVRVYFSVFAANYPFVTLPDFTNTASLRMNRPATFLAVLAAASITTSFELNATLNQELLTNLTRRLMLEGEHTLDLVQAMIIMTIWYAPLDKFESLRHYQLAHLACTIAMDIGLGDNDDSADEGDSHGKYPTEDRFDARRTMISIYLLCTGIAVTTGRPNMLRFTPYKQKETLRCLHAQPNVSKADRWFLAWVTLQRFSENAAEVFFSGRTPVDITNSEYQEKVVEFCRKLEQWRAEWGHKLGGALEIHYHYTRSIVLCVCLYVNHDLDDFRPPFRIRPLDAVIPPPPPLTPFLARTVLALVANIHASLDAFLSLDTKTLIATPMIYYVRTCHPLCVLLILELSCRRVGSELSKILDQSMLKVEHYFLVLAHMLSAVPDNDARKAPAKFLATIKTMETWWRSQGHTSGNHDLRPFSPRHQATTGSFPAVPAMISPGGAHMGHPVSQSQQKTSLPLQVSPESSNPSEDDLFLDNWMLDLSQDPQSMLMPEVDWSLFEDHSIIAHADLLSGPTLPPG